MRDKAKIIVAMMFLLVLSLLTYSTAERDSDLDGIPDSTDKYPFDYDNDGMPDIWEKKNGLRYDINDANDDPDEDGIKNIDEYKKGTNPLVADLVEKTTIKEEEPRELLSPVERTMAKSLVWVGAGVFLLLVIVFILYRAYIFRVFKFMHHVSKEHFEKEEITPITPKAAVPTAAKPALLPRYRAPPQRVMPPTPYPKRVAPGAPAEIPKPSVKEAAEPKVLVEDWEDWLKKRRGVWERRYVVNTFKGQEKIKEEMKRGGKKRFMFL